jgi:hypothetical protein
MEPHFQDLLRRLEELSAQVEELRQSIRRGGSWAQTPDECRAAHRWHGDDGKRYPNLGCRMVLCLD